jgi:hypothetical protein
MQPAAVAEAGQVQVFEATQYSAQQAADKRGAVEQNGGAREQGGSQGPVTSLPGRLLRCKRLERTGAAPAMPCKTALDAAGRRRPYEGAEASLCRAIGQQTLDAQRGLLLHLGVLGVLGPFNLQFDFRPPSVSRGSQYLTLRRQTSRRKAGVSCWLSARCGPGFVRNNGWNGAVCRHLVPSSGGANGS